MTHYEIRIHDPRGGGTSMIVPIEKADDMAALNTALELCRQQKIEVWGGGRQIGAVSLSGTPRLTL